MEQLSGDSLYAAVSGFSTSQIIDLCAANRELNTELCDSEKFWQYRYIQERGVPDRNPTSWKRAYFIPDIYIINRNLEQPWRFSFHKEIADVHIHYASIVDEGQPPPPRNNLFPSLFPRPRKFVPGIAYILTTDGEVYLINLLSSDQRFQRLNINDRIKQITLPRRPYSEFLVLTDHGDLYHGTASNYILSPVLPLRGKDRPTPLLSVRMPPSIAKGHQIRRGYDDKYLSTNDLIVQTSLIRTPFEVKLMSDDGHAFLSADDELYFYPEGFYRFGLESNPQPRNVQLPSNITQMVTNSAKYKRLHFIADGIFYTLTVPDPDKGVYYSRRITAPGEQVLYHSKIPYPYSYDDNEWERHYESKFEPKPNLEIPSKVRKLIRPLGLPLLDNGTLWTGLDTPEVSIRDASESEYSPLHPGTRTIVDYDGNVWVNFRKSEDDQWHKLNLPTKMSHTSNGTVWGYIKTLVTSFAHFSQLVNRGKIPEFKVPPQPGMNEPYIDTFLIPDLEGYQYEVTARYDPQTGQMTAP